MLRPSLCALAGPLLALSLTGCGGADEPSTADVKADVSAQLVETGLEGDQADCFADVVVDELGVDNVRDVDFSADEPPKGQEEEFAAAAVKAIAACEIDLSKLDG